PAYLARGEVFPSQALLSIGSSVRYEVRTYTTIETTTRHSNSMPSGYSGGPLMSRRRLRRWRQKQRQQPGNQRDDLRQDGDERLNQRAVAELADVGREIGVDLGHGQSLVRLHDGTDRAV